MAAPTYNSIMYVASYVELMAITTAQVGQIAIDTSSKITYSFDGTNWTTINRVAVKKSSVAVNTMATTAGILIYTLEQSSLKFYPTQVVLRLANRTGTILTQPVISIGTNAPAYDNIATSSLLTSLIGSLSVGNGAPAMASTSPPLNGGTGIYAKVTTATTGATVNDLNAEVLGFYDT